MTGNEVRLREVPNLNSKVKTYLKKGEAVLIIESNSSTASPANETSWFKVITQDGLSGWSSGSFLRDVPPDITIEDNPRPLVKYPDLVRVDKTTTSLLLDNGDWKTFSPSPDDPDGDYNDSGLPVFVGLIAEYYLMVVPHSKYSNDELVFVRKKDGLEMRDYVGDITVSPDKKYLLLNAAAMCCGPSINIFHIGTGSLVASFPSHSQIPQNSGAIWLGSGEIMFWEGDEKGTNMILNIARTDGTGTFTIVASTPIR